MIIWKGNRNLF